MTRIFLLLLIISLFSCKKGEEVPAPPKIEEDELYFPPISGDNWEETTPEALDWDPNELESLYTFLENNKTRAFIILKDGKIVAERYWGNNILNTVPFDKDTKWYWASAGKTVTAFLVGMAQEEGLLNIDDKTSDYLGENWTDLLSQQERLITIRNQLTMTTGLDYELGNLDCTEPSCLQFKANPGEQWFYHNAPYTLLEKVISNAAGIEYNQFTDTRLETKIGMNGSWIKSGYNNVYWSNARDAARFGLLILNNGKWEDEPIMTDSNYYDAMVTSSQTLNPSYGYLWWLNGKDRIIFPSFSNTFNTSLAPQAPMDIFAAMGKNGQFVGVVPSQNLVVVRMGEAPSNDLVPVTFHDEMWGIIGKVIGE